MITLKIKEKGVKKGYIYCGRCARYASIGFSAQSNPHDVMCALFGVFLKRDRGKLLRCQDCLDAEIDT